MSQVTSQLLNKNSLIYALVSNIALFTFGIRIFAHGVRVESARPKIAALEIFFDALMLQKISLAVMLVIIVTIQLTTNAGTL